MAGFSFACRQFAVHLPLGFFDVLLEALLAAPALAIIAGAARSRLESKETTFDVLSLGPPARAGGVSVFPIYGPRRVLAATPRRWSDARRLLVTERTEESIESVWVRNGGPAPVILPTGVVLRGGLQDRIIADDLVISAGDARAVRTCCVERGRWNPRPFRDRRRFSPERELAPPSVCAAAQCGAQGSVWSEVAQFNRAMRCRPQTGSLVPALRAEARRRAHASISRRVQRKLRRFPFRAHVVGFAVAEGASLVGAHWYCSHAVYHRFRDVAWASVFRDLDGEGPRTVACSYARMRSYLAERIAEVGDTHDAARPAVLVRCRGEAPAHVLRESPRQQG